MVLHQHIWIWDATHGFERDTTPRAMPYLERLVESGTIRGPDRPWIAESYLRAGRTREAMDLVRDDARGLAKLARILHERGDAAMADAASTRALATLERQRAAQPDNESLAENANADDLVLWLASKEAKALLAEPAEDH
jgi:hypothetical protein